ncbi:prepilin-type N-terminal cleavage/methylation domain-containing protein [Thalassotalea maritima]|uniref:prepilin-type N-terminal cleavage/methylation domain-containing protein n=1 Tax=Thalassotalea maritima TaxID=3242416 RepID=UPI0035286120
MQLTRRYTKQHGFTLVELLLSMVFGLIVLSGVTYVYVSVISSSSSTLQNTKLNSQVATMMAVISADIRRAGYWANATHEEPSDNPFNVDDDTLLVIVNSMADSSKILENTDQSGSCVLYSYDRNINGVVDALGVDNELFGVRLNDGAVEMRLAGSVSDADSCTDGTWEVISDKTLYTVTELSFNPVNSACINSSEPNDVDAVGDGNNVIDDDAEFDCYNVTPQTGDITVETREVLITLAARLNRDTDVRTQIAQAVRVRNDVVRIR